MMNKNVKKLITIILILAMGLSLLSFSAFAEENNDNETPPVTEQPEPGENEPPEPGPTDPDPPAPDPAPKPDPEPEPQPEPEPATGFIIVRYMDENGANISEPYRREYNLGRHTLEARSFPGYTLLGSSTQSVTLSEQGQQREISFAYRRDAQEPAVEERPTQTQPAPTPPTVEEPEPQLPVVAIHLVAEPYKTEYLIGEELELDGLVIFREFSDGQEEEIPLEELSASGFNSEEPAEEQIVTVEYEGFSVEFVVTIEDDRPAGFFSRLFSIPLLNFLLFLLLLVAAVVAIVLLVRRRKKAQGAKPQKTEPEVLAKNKKKRLALIIVGAIIAILLVAYAGAMYFLAQMEREEIPLDDDSLGIVHTGTPGITNIAILGIDSKDGMSGRSDAIMILTLDEIHDKIKITSIPRDSYVDIPGRGLDKINHAHAFGGPELAIKTINQNFNLDIRHFVSVNFTSMPAIIDAVGGVEVQVTDREAREISGISSGGTHRLNGKQALRFSRIRKMDSDFERTRRQRDVMESTIESALKAPLTSYPGMVNNVFPHLTTNLTSNQMLNLGRKAVTNNINSIEKLQFPPRSLGSGQSINGVYYYVFDRAEGARLLSDYIYKDIPVE